MYIHRHERAGKHIARWHGLLCAMRRCCVDSRKLSYAYACKKTAQRRRVKALGCKNIPLCGNKGLSRLVQNCDNVALRGLRRLF
jgi:hypothetical protein